MVARMMAPPTLSVLLVTLASCGHALQLSAVAARFVSQGLAARTSVGAQLMASAAAEPTEVAPAPAASVQGFEALEAELEQALGQHFEQPSTEDYFATVVHLVEEHAALPPEAGRALPAEVPRLLRQVLDADFEALLERAKRVTNVTCMQPVDTDEGYELFDDTLLALPLRPGRACDGGVCCDACSRVNFPVFATPAEVRSFKEELEFVMAPPFHHFELSKCAFRDARATLIFVRLVERMRRAIAHEYGLPLGTIAPVNTFVALFTGEQEKKEGSLHADESSFGSFHYSCVMYLTTQHEDFEGGTFNFNDPPPEGDESGERVLTPLSPRSGSAVVFSSGWENMHEVEPLRSGLRIAVPAFFTTHPAKLPSAATVDDGAIAQELWRTLLCPESPSDFKEFQMNWHDLLAVAPSPA